MKLTILTFWDKFEAKHWQKSKELDFIIDQVRKEAREEIIEEIRKMHLWSKGTAEGTVNDIIYRLRKNEKNKSI